MMTNLRCRVCGSPLTYQGRGTPPEMHPACRELSNDVARVARSLRAAWGSEGISPRGLRRWLLGELFSLVNEVTSSAIPRMRRPALVRLETFLASMVRTEAGRVALRSKGIGV